MVEIDKRPNDQERNKNPVRNRGLPRKTLPDCEKKQCRDQLYGEISKGDFRAAIRAATAQQNPADQGQIVIPRDWLFAGRTKRATRFVNRKVGRPAIDADIQKRSNRRAENKGKRAEEELVNGMLHARLLGDRP